MSADYEKKTDSIERARIIVNKRFKLRAASIVRKRSVEPERGNENVTYVFGVTELPPLVPGEPVSLVVGTKKNSWPQRARYELFRNTRTRPGGDAGTGQSVSVDRPPVRIKQYYAGARATAGNYSSRRFINILSALKGSSSVSAAVLAPTLSRHHLCTFTLPPSSP